MFGRERVNILSFFFRSHNCHPGSTSITLPVSVIQPYTITRPLPGHPSADVRPSTGINGLIASSFVLTKVVMTGGTSFKEILTRFPWQSSRF